MTDHIIRALAYDDQIKVFVMDAHEMVEEARRRHDTWYTSTAALGRMLMGTALLAANLKGNDRISAMIQGSGPIGQIVAQADALGNVRGAIHNPHVSLPLNEMQKIDVSSGIGLPGTLMISKYIENMDPFTGTVQLVSGEIAEDFTYYLAASEQIPSAMGLSVLVDKDESIKTAGGFLIQVLPGATDETLTELEQTVTHLGQISDLMSAGLTTEQLLDRLVGEGNSRILTQMPLHYLCPCDKVFYASKLALLGAEDIEAMIEEQGEAEVVCHYCNEKYNYDYADLEAILAQALSREGDK